MEEVDERQGIDLVFQSLHSVESVSDDADQEVQHDH